MKTIKSWNVGLDRITKIGWPWHGKLQQVSDTRCTLTSPTGEVINFDNGDLSHAIAYPVSLTGASSWRSGICQRYQIPGIAAATTTPDEQAEGMTWLNYFIESGIARFGGSYDTLIDDDNKPWRIKVLFTGFVPTKIEVWHVVAGVMVKRLDVDIPAPGFVSSPPTLYAMGRTVSSTGRYMVYNMFGAGTDTPFWAFSITITGSVIDETLAATVSRLIDSDITGLSGSESVPLSSTATWSRFVRHRLYRTPIGYTAWSVVEGSGQDGTDSGSWGPSSTGFLTTYGTQADSVAYPTPTVPADDDDYHYGWNVNTGSFVSGPEKYYVGYTENQVEYFRSWKCIGYFVGHDDTLVRAESWYERKTATTTTRATEEYADIIGHQEIEYFDYLKIAGRETARVRVVEVKDGVNSTWTVTTPAAPRGLVVNCIARGHRAVALANATGTSIGAYDQYAFAHVCGQVADAALYPATFLYNGSEVPQSPNFSVSPVTGELFTRVGDGRPVCFV